jgi:hypothetical protein
MLDTLTPKTPRPDFKHPWHPFAHAEHMPEDLHRVLRVLRSNLTELHVMQSEAQMTCFFRQLPKNVRLTALQQACEWLLENATCAEEITQHGASGTGAPGTTTSTVASLVPILANPHTRRMIQEFARNVACVRGLQELLRDKLSAPAVRLVAAGDEVSLAHLSALFGEARRTTEELDIAQLNRRDLDSQMASASKREKRIESSLLFFQQVSRAMGAPHVTRCEQGRKLLAALECIERIPAPLRAWREEHILDAGQRLRLQTWKVRARPILELRKEMAAHFILDAQVDNAVIAAPELLRLAEVFKVDSWFAHFSASYRETLHAYRELLVSKAARKIDRKESDYQRAERLLSWVSLLEQTQAFETSEDACAAFAPHFRGIDTDFTSAIEAGVWAQKIREEVLRSDELSYAFEDAVFNDALLDFVMYVPDEKISLAGDIVKSTEADEVREFLREFQASGEPRFAQIAETARKRQLGLESMAAMAVETGLAEDVPFSITKNIQETLEEILFLVHRMNSNMELRELLQGLYAGPSSDLVAIEVSARYVRHVATAQLPESLSDTIIDILLSARGPQALSEARPQLERCMHAITSVRAQFASLEAITHGQVRELTGGQAFETVSTSTLLEALQNALRQPQFFVPLVTQLKQFRAQGALRFPDDIQPENPNALGLTVERAPHAEHINVKAPSKNENAPL